MRARRNEYEHNLSSAMYLGVQLCLYTFYKKVCEIEEGEKGDN